MSAVADLIADMVRAGVDPDLIGRTAAALSEREPVKIVDEQAARRRAKDRDRKRLRNSAESADSAEDLNLSSPKGSSPTPPSPKPLQSIPPSPPKGGSSPTPKSELEAVLDADRADAVIQHRQKIRKPLTAHAAKLLAGKFRRCPDANAAADAMIANGWQGFEIEWMENRSASRHQPQAPPNKPKSEFMQHQDDVQRVLDEATGRSRNDEFTGSTFDLGPRDYRAG
ncbi:hypothetical protein FHX10_004555 [Rhizobium sp. BK591]|uniref:hypothetical protein n=1 Tax=Rhizobium sp. BK591 TaxID=2586985 RepID=UPI001607A59B|nr:hypothetical protein [Rhizobium sp. BK591]MBB3745018.1 hypothetical protein [Rhizobium sp. BK591]